MFPLMDKNLQQNVAHEEVEGVWLGAAVTLLPAPMTELQFPPEMLKEAVLARFVSFLPLYRLLV